MPTTKNNPDKRPINRPLVGLIALSCLASGAYLCATTQSDNQQTMLWGAGLGRAGLLMGAFWFALPTKNRPAAWATVSKGKMAGIIFAIGAIVVQPKVFVPMFAVLLVVSFLFRPGRSRHRPDRDSWDKK